MIKLFYVEGKFLTGDPGPSVLYTEDRKESKKLSFIQSSLRMGKTIHVRPASAEERRWAIRMLKRQKGKEVKKDGSEGKSKGGEDHSEV